MRAVPQLLIRMALASAVLLPLAAHAQPKPAAAAAEMSTGEVQKIDKSAKKVTLKHGEIKNLNMPPMTMGYDLRTPAMVDKLKVGDQVRFRVVLEGGKYIVTEIVLAK